MEKSNRDNIVLLFDYFNLGSRDLLASFSNAGYQIKAVCINDEGFLPDNVENVFEYFLGDISGGNNLAKPLYFNQIKVPEYWQISGNNNSGSVHDKSKERGRIFYQEPKNKRLVKVVDWLDEDGVVKASDHYNKYGICYGRTIFNKFAKKVSISYFDAKGKEVIVENFVARESYFGTMLYNNILFVGIIVYYFLAEMIPTGKMSEVLADLGGVSFFIFAVHEMYVSPVQEIVKDLMGVSSLSYVIVFIIVTLCALGTSLFCKRLSPLLFKILSGNR